MNWLFLRQPPDEPEMNSYTVASKSKTFALETFKSAESDFARANARVDDAVEKSDDSWQSEQLVSRAEENFDSAEERLRHSKLKYRWEYDEQWKKVVRRTQARIQNTVRLLMKLDWNAILKRPKK